MGWLSRGGVDGHDAGRDYGARGGDPAGACAHAGGRLEQRDSGTLQTGAAARWICDLGPKRISLVFSSGQRNLAGNADGGEAFGHAAAATEAGDGRDKPEDVEEERVGQGRDVDHVLLADVDWVHVIHVMSTPGVQMCGERAFTPHVPAVHTTLDEVMS